MEEQMSYEEELMFGLKRWIIKALRYVDGRDFNEFLKDDKSFDATSYCLEVIDEIANQIVNNKKILEQYKDVDFKILANLKKNIYVQDNINLTEYQNYIERIFPLTISKLIVK